MIQNSKTLFLTFCMLSTYVVQAQKYFPGRNEFGFCLGVSNYHGDLAREIVPAESKFMAAAFYQRHINEWASLRYQLSYGRISGSDQNYPEVYANRNLNFYSDIIEGAITLEYNFLPFGLNPNLRWATPYVFAGIGMFYFNPKTKYNNEPIELRDLGTEGQGLNGTKKYNLFQPAIPLGIGIKFTNGKVTSGLELGFRKTFTDYLDDVKGDYPDYNLMLNERGELAATLSHRYSQNISNIEIVEEGKMRGDPNLNDWYFFLNFRLGFRIFNPPCNDNFSF